MFFLIIFYNKTPLKNGCLFAKVNHLTCKRKPKQPFLITRSKNVVFLSHLFYLEGRSLKKYNFPIGWEELFFYKHKMQKQVHHMLPSASKPQKSVLCKTHKTKSVIFFPSFTILLFTLTLYVPFLGLPPFRYGWYTQLELLTAGFWCMGGLAALWNIILFKHKKRLTLYL